jgi:hypothetical protein
VTEVPQALPLGYAELLSDIKQRVRHAQTRAVLAVNAELIRLYWDIGALIDKRQKQEGWGAGVIPRLASDLHNALPEEKGFSERNIKRMLAFYREYPLVDFVPQAVAQSAATPEVPQAVALFEAQLLQAIPWGHHAELMAKIKDLPKPIGVSGYELTRALPENLGSSLPSIEEIERELQGDEA